ncbi:MAG TPA: hypothetical protein VNB94_06080 [Mycobacteriales bacterium]|nr:hypothetical protein [Mycobacteriales bacterium]
MRSRLAALLGVALIGSGVTVLGVTLSAQAAGEGERLYLHSANGGYAADVAADPTSTLGSAPAGSKADTTAPTSTTSDTATVRPTANAPASGQPDTPSFRLPVTGAVSSVCLDLFASGPTGASISVFGFLSDANDSKLSELAELKVTPYPGGIVRLTGNVTPKTPFTATANVAIGFFAGALNGPGSNVVLSYDSVNHPSNVTINPTSCTPVAVSAPSGSASGSASAAPTASRTATPSVSASASATASASAAPSASGSSTPSQCPTSAAPSTSATATSAPTPSSSSTPTSNPTPTSTATAVPSASPSATTSATPRPTATGMTPPATGAPVVGKQASGTPSTSTSPTPAPTSSPSAPPTDGCNTPTRITLNVTVARITAGNAPTLFGVVTDDLNKPVVGAQVDILAKGYAQPAYSRVATVVTDAEGRYALRTAPGRQTSYGANVGAIRSRVIQVRVNTRVDIARPAPGTVSNPVTFSGQLTPRFANVAVGLGYLTNGRFVVLTQTRTNANGGYSLTRALPRGTFAFVVFTSAHEGTDKGSKSVRLTVR